MMRNHFKGDSVPTGMTRSDLYMCGDWYEDVDSPADWHDCPKCGLKPRIWVYDNGRHTACGCGVSMYDHFSIRAESIASSMQHSHNGRSMADHDSDGLRNNWNHWCETGEIIFPQNSYSINGRW